MSSIKRVKGELQYDYCARRAMEKEVEKEQKRGKVVWQGSMGPAKNATRDHSSSKKDKKRMRKARRAMRFALNS